MKKLLSLILFVLPTLILAQGNLDLVVCDYAYIDASGKIFTEKENPNTVIIGHYDTLNVRTSGTRSTFTFNLRKEKRQNGITSETYVYEVKENSETSWTLEREDGVQLSLDYNKNNQRYYLHIPLSATNKEAYLYIFNSYKASTTVFKHSFHGEYNPVMNDYSFNMIRDSSKTTEFHLIPEKSKIIITSGTDTLYNHYIVNLEPDEDYLIYHTTNYMYEAVFMININEGITMLYDWVDQTNNTNMHYKYKYFWSNK